jgi:hypothetical protein
MAENTEHRELPTRREYVQREIKVLMERFDIDHIKVSRKDDVFAWEEHKRIRTDYI